MGNIYHELRFMNCILLSAFIGQYIELNILIFSQSLRHREHFVIFHSEPFMSMTFEIHFDSHVLHDIQNKVVLC